MSKQKCPTWSFLRDWVWENHYRRCSSPATARSILQNLPIPDDIRITSLTRPRIRKVLEDLRAKNLSEGTIRRYLGTLMRTLREAHKEGFLSPVPAPPSLPKPKRGRVRYLQQGEEEALTTALQPSHRDLAVFLMDTGARLGEALSLRWEHLSTGAAVFESEKTDNFRVVPLTSRAKSLLLETDPSEGPFSQVDVWSFRRDWNKAKVAMGLESDEEFVPHCLRHTFASRLVQRGVEIPVVQKLLGHRRIETTMIYAHVAPGQLSDAVSVLEN